MFKKQQKLSKDELEYEDNNIQRVSHRLVTYFKEI